MKKISGVLALVLLFVGVLSGCDKEEAAPNDLNDAAKQAPKDHPAH